MNEDRAKEVIEVQIFWDGAMFCAKIIGGDMDAFQRAESWEEAEQFIHGIMGPIFDEDGPVFVQVDNYDMTDGEAWLYERRRSE